jgi:Fe-S cluster assembly protein SufA
LSDTAAEHIKKISGEQCLHLSVKNSGCTGYAYVLQLIDQPCADDVMFEHNQAKIYVALQAMPILDGTRIDYEQQGLNSTFTYQNPNVKAICGCGESFGV